MVTQTPAPDYPRERARRGREDDLRAVLFATYPEAPSEWRDLAKLIAEWRTDHDATAADMTDAGLV